MFILLTRILDNGDKMPTFINFNQVRSVRPRPHKLPGAPGAVVVFSDVTSYKVAESLSQVQDLVQATVRNGK